MAVYKRGKVWWFHFVFDGERVQESTKQGSRRVAEQIEAARKTQLAKAEVGISDRMPAPTLVEFSQRFIREIETQCATKPRTVSFYQAKLNSLLQHETLPGTRLDLIDEAVIDSYKQKRSRTISRRGRPLSPASVNRELATLRRLLRLAHEWRVIQRIPRIRLLRGERHREFVLNQKLEGIYLASLPQPLRDVAVVLLDTGLRIGELITLEWPQVRIQPVSSARFGFLTVSYTKAKSSRNRNVPLSARVVEVLHQRKRENGLVFHVGDEPLSGTLLDQQHARIRSRLKLPADFVLHSLRHTFGTRLGESGADVFAIMKLMGHSTLTVSQRYVHPSPEALELAYGRMIDLNLPTPATLSATLTLGEPDTPH